MAVGDCHTVHQPLREAVIHDCLARTMGRIHPLVVSTWPFPAGRSLIAAGWSDDIVSVAGLAAESAELLTDVQRSLGAAKKDRGGLGTNARYELLGARQADVVPNPARAAALIQLHGSLVHFVWALVLPAISAKLSAEEVDVAHNALLHTTRRSLGITHDLMT